MAKRSKNYRKAAQKVADGVHYSPLEAMRLAKETSTAKFDATVEVMYRLGVDPRKADQMVRGTVNLPHGTGKTARVLVFARSQGQSRPPRPRPRPPRPHAQPEDGHGDDGRRQGRLRHQGRPH